ncbi:hypothetical protein FFLO_03052 [Filobasidium floriforme]|uniref:Uncharacterized protein n=1 Tax=Filobasidium floriforme TaxID=5210 RepID=A0A8K0NNL2_9TREE|nr:hypothetical protein FFLO_03052 [Filobasidium floriforme]
MSMLDPPTVPTSKDSAQLALLQQASSVAQQASPQLAALYRARVRLLSDLPSESTRGWCCSTCGNLRDGYGWKLVRGQRKKKSSPKEKRIKNSLADGSDMLGTNAEAGPSTPSLAQKNVLKGKCSICGTAFKSKGSKSEVVASFPSARSIARRTRSSSGQVNPERPSDALDLTPSSVVPVEVELDHSSPAKPLTPNLLQASPSLAHIPISDPTPASCPLPPTSPSSLPSTSTPSSRSATPVGGVPKATTGRKKKKSGLAKLLADSAARKEQEQQSLGGLSRWGLN